MKMQTNLSGRLRNTSLPLAAGLLPLFEAVVNSIHGIEEAGGKTEDGRISVEILRKPKQETLATDDSKKKKGPEAVDDIVGFKVTDNGIGFTDANMLSFQTLDTDHKAAKGCRGVGRLLWLKAFKTVRVSSVFAGEDKKYYRRTFDFDPSGVNRESKELLTGKHKCETIVHLDDFKSIYREHARKTLESISENILEHCLWYFVRPGGAPAITVWDCGVSEPLDGRYEAQMHSSADSESIKLNEVDFNLVHVRLRSNSLSSHSVAYCADNRLVLEEPLAGKIPGLHGRITDGEEDFVYMCYVSSDYLNDRARSERTGFDIPESMGELFATTEITFPRIRAAVIEQAAKNLQPYLEGNLMRSRERVQNFVSTKAPRYRPILKRIPGASLNIDPDITDRDLDIALHKQLAEIEGEFLEEGHNLISSGVATSADDYRKQLDAYLSKASDLKMSDLANYVSHRKVIIELLAKSIVLDESGKYAREDIIHELIMPMRTTSDETSPERCNLWLVDERLAFHDFLASDKTIASMPITGSESAREPDLVALSVFDNPILFSEKKDPPLASIVVVEIKRPMRNNAAPGEIDDPVEQAINYLQQIRKGKAQTPGGRLIPESEDIPGFCYILADITPTLRERCLFHHDLQWRHDKMGFFGYKANSKAFIEVISFDGLVSAAKQRNRAFFDKLGLPAD